MRVRDGMTRLIDPLSRLTRTQIAGVVILAALVIIAVTSDWLAPYDTKEMFTPYMRPSAEHWLGTNDMGYDIFSELLVSTKVSLTVGFLSAIIATSIGTAVGLFAGYSRGALEEVLMGTTDVFLLIPGLPLMIVLAAYMGPSMWNIILVIGVLWWCPTARVVHSRVLQVRTMPFIQTTKAMGFSETYIALRHVLPNTRAIIAAKFSLAVAMGMLSEASLSFIGLGDPVNLSWGGMIYYAFSRGGLSGDMYWWYLSPGLMISISVLAFTLLTMGRDERFVPEGLG